MIKPIQTRFRGFHFRSRLEARWGVFFDALGVQWEYEPEGFVLPDGTRYLPDFKVTAPSGTVTWYEIKPQGHAPCEKMRALSHAFYQQEREEERSPEGCRPSGTQFQTLAGDPAWVLIEQPFRLHACPRCGSIQKDVTFERSGHVGIEIGCWPCDFTTPGGGGHGEELGVLGLYTPHKGWICVQTAEAVVDYWTRISAAAEAARSARFEHGQSGATL